MQAQINKFKYARIGVVSLVFAAMLGASACSTAQSGMKAEENANLEAMARASMAEPRGVNNTLLNAELRMASSRLQAVRNQLFALSQEVESLAQKMNMLEAQLGGGQPAVALAAPVSLAPANSSPAGLAPATAAPVAIAMPETSGMTVVSEREVVPGVTRRIYKMSPVADAKKPATKPAAPKAVAAKAVTPGVNSIRIGEHPDKVRIVLDVKGKPDFSTDLDRTENLLTVDLPGLPWRAASNGAFGKLPVVKSYTAKPAGNGSIVVFDLKQDTSILDVMSLNATKGQPAKVVIDLKK